MYRVIITHVGTGPLTISLQMVEDTDGQRECAQPEGWRFDYT
jgi:hypothetical protein